MSDQVPMANSNAGAMTPAQRRAMIAEKARQRTEAGDVPKARSGAVFMSFDGNTGETTYGREKTPLPEGQTLVVPLDTIRHGIRFWEGGKPKKDAFVPVLEGPAPTPPEGEPRVGDLPKPRQRDGWTDTITLQFCGVDGGDLEGIILEQDCSSQGAHGAAVELLGKMMERARAGEMFDAIISYEVGSYENKTYGRTIFYPEFKVLEWTDGENREPAEVPQIAADDVLG